MSLCACVFKSTEVSTQVHIAVDITTFKFCGFAVPLFSLFPPFPLLKFTSLSFPFLLALVTAAGGIFEHFFGRWGRWWSPASGGLGLGSSCRWTAAVGLVAGSDWAAAAVLAPDWAAALGAWEVGFVADFVAAGSVDFAGWVTGFAPDWAVVADFVAVAAVFAPPP